MPTLQEIQQFKEVLNRLGDEPAILAERGEAIEDVPAPDQVAQAEGLPAEGLPAEGLPEGLSDLLDTGEGQPAAFEQAPASRAARQAAAETAPQPSAEPGVGEEEFDLEELLGIGKIEGVDDLGALGATAEEAPAEATAEAPGEAPAEEALEEFAIPEGLLGPTEEGPAGEEPAAEEAPAAEPFELPEMEPPAEVAAEATAEAPAGAGEAAGIGLGEFELPQEFEVSDEDLGPIAGAGAQEQAPAAGGELAAEPTAEEAEFLRALEQDIFPAAEGGVEEQAPEAAEQIEEPRAEAPQPASVEEAFDLSAEGLPGEAAEAGEPAPVGEHVDLEAAHVPETAPLDEFALEDFGQAFEVAEEAAPAAAGEEGPPAEVSEGPAAGTAREAPEEEEALRLTDRQFEALKRSLGRFPRNLKLAIEELIAEKGLAGAELRAVVDLLVKGASPAAVAERVSRISGRRIVLPRSYARLSGLAFEAERRTFGYAFRENIWPILRVAVLGLAFVGLLGFLGYRYVYKPLYANVLYRQGYGQIAKERYRLANERFDRAAEVWEFKSWFYRYAQAFAAKRQYQLAGEKYERLLKSHPVDRRGILQYAALLSEHLAGYEKADALLQRLLQQNIKDYPALLAQGDNFLQWAESETDAGTGSARLESARFAYASIIDYYGERDEVLLRMMRYFIRLDRMSGQDKLAQTRDLKEYLDGRRRLRVGPELLASVYAELGGYWIDKGRLDEAPKILFRAMDARMEVPEIHYHLARYYRAVREAAEEEKALEAAIELLERTQPLDKKRLFLLIDSYNRRGEAYYRRQEYLDAEKMFRKAIAEIEQAQARRMFGSQPEFGLAYKNQADLYYYVSRDLVAALDLYERAAANGYRSPDLDYKIGYVHYAEERYEAALLAFARVVDQKPTNENALFALANCLYQGGYHASAQGYYLRLLEILEGREQRIRYLQPMENPEHRALVERLMQVYNNLGVVLRRLGERSRDPDKESKALVNLTFSSERFDLISRDPQTAARGLTQNLAFLNQRGILYPQAGFQLQIYRRLPLDLEALDF